MFKINLDLFRTNLIFSSTFEQAFQESTQHVGKFTQQSLKF